MHVFLVAAWAGGQSPSGTDARRALASDVSPVAFWRRATARGDLVAVLDAVMAGRGEAASCVDDAPVVVYAHQRALVVTDVDYAPRVAVSLVRRVSALQLFDVGGVVDPEATLAALLETYQTPHTADVITAIQGDLDATRASAAASMSALLERGERLDRLTQNSDALVADAREFERDVRGGCCGRAGCIGYVGWTASACVLQ